jgi:hypothetical protein
MKRMIAAVMIGTVLSSAAAPVYAVTFKRSWQSCEALAEERGFIGTYTRGRLYKARFVRSCRIGTQI